MPIYTYKCEDGHIETRLRKIDRRTDHTVCKQCDKPAFFIISAPTISLDGTDPAFPDAYAKFEKVHSNASSQHI